MSTVQTTNSSLAIFRAGRFTMSKLWIFPLIITAILLLLTAYKVNGSSIGIYNQIFYGSNHKDTALIAGKPRIIRSDEWQWNSQMIMAQAQNDYKRVNNNFGNGQDMSLIVDVPYKDWSAIFRPQNLPFFVLPFDYAFALKWWLLSYFLLLSCYFFVLAVLPRRFMVAALLSVMLLFSPFTQWWYQYITLAPMYYCLAILALFIGFLQSRSRKRIVLGAAAISYLTACFALVLYPPFQIPCAIATVGFGLGYALQHYKKTRYLALQVSSLVVAGVLALCIVGAFILTRSGPINAVEHTDYPGQRRTESGGYPAAHLFSGHLDYQLIYQDKAEGYILNNGIANQSEEANFVYLLPFLFLPGLYIVWRDRQVQRPTDWPMVLVSLVFALFLAWMFIPGLDIVGKVTLLNRVQLNRMIIGFGLLNLMQLLQFIKRYSTNEFRFNAWLVAAIGVAAYAIEFLLGHHAKVSHPGFIGDYRVIAYSLPLPVVLTLLLYKRFRLAVVGLMLFAVFMAIRVNPLYRGTAILTANPLVTYLEKTTSSDQGRIASEPAYLENIALVSGNHSMNGTFSYPQPSLWTPLGNTTKRLTYNRFAHSRFDFSAGLTSDLQLTGGNDQFVINAAPCSQFLRVSNVKRLITEEPLSQSNCIILQHAIRYPDKHLYIYKSR